MPTAIVEKEEPLGSDKFDPEASLQRIRQHQGRFLKDEGPAQPQPPTSPRSTSFLSAEPMSVPAEELEPDSRLGHQTKYKTKDVQPTPPVRLTPIVSQNEIQKEEKQRQRREVERWQIAETAHANMEMVTSSVFRLPIEEMNDETYQTNKEGGWQRMVRPVIAGWLVPIIMEDEGGLIRDKLGGFLPGGLKETDRDYLLKIVCRQMAAIESFDLAGADRQEEAAATIKDLGILFEALREAYSVEEVVGTKEVIQKDGTIKEVPISEVRDFWGRRTLPKTDRETVYRACLKVLSAEPIKCLRDSGLLPPRVEQQLRVNLPDNFDGRDVKSHALPLLAQQFNFFRSLQNILVPGPEEEKNQPGWSGAWLTATAMRELAQRHLSTLERQKEDSLPSERESIEAKIEATKAFRDNLGGFIESCNQVLGEPCLTQNGPILAAYNREPPHPYDVETEEGVRHIVPLIYDLVRVAYPRAWRRSERILMTGQPSVEYEVATLARQKAPSPSALVNISALTMEALEQFERRGIAWELETGQRLLTPDQALRSIRFMTERFGLELSGRDKSDQAFLESVLETAVIKNGVAETKDGEERSLPVQVAFDAVDEILRRKGVYDQYADFGDRSIWVAWQTAVVGYSLRQLRASLTNNRETLYHELLNIGKEGRVSLDSIPQVIRRAELDGHKIVRVPPIERREKIIPTRDDVVEALTFECPGQINALVTLTSSILAAVYNAKDLCGDPRLDPEPGLEFPPQHVHISGFPGTGKTFLIAKILDYLQNEHDILIPWTKFGLEAVAPTTIEGAKIREDPFLDLVRNTMKLFGCDFEEACNIASRLGIIFFDEVHSKLAIDLSQPSELTQMALAVRRELLTLMGDASGKPVSLKVLDRPDRHTPATNEGEVIATNILYILAGAYEEQQATFRGMQAAAEVPFIPGEERYVPITRENAHLVMGDALADRISRYTHLPRVTQASLRQVAEIDTLKRIGTAVRNFLRKRELPGVTNIAIDPLALELMARAAIEAGGEFRGLQNRVGPRVSNSICEKLERGEIVFEGGILAIDLRTVQEALGLVPK